ncbi:hypothetical protein Smp_158890 [Schistosoma mansoni]|uniref:hypothetical protein n=1 Tax=Schistosoma mansoni TaxID=6183 RepID=UPI00022DC039|nr:hypothetical protein Smp_158890 [Schistosoma mansoni]|eukprot:XP_018651627.1 hypothetical protein Smp_158890 [Schistosoma mansoni]
MIFLLGTGGNGVDKNIRRNRNRGGDSGAVLTSLFDWNGGYRGSGKHETFIDFSSQLVFWITEIIEGTEAVVVVVMEAVS